ncbi:stalk domain-containing protein [Deinococcus yavapaiensis]|uniref:stalk domain-containing protein n=1 Tax=Deinococcus yavapaiensis TaxID=309889 RepID=UPI001472D378|nr:stalk domain-containing protein [Deinococcus yavapaiensis]
MTVPLRVLTLPILLASTLAAAQLPPQAVANAAVEVSGAIGGRIVDCPKTLNVSSSAVCLVAKGTLDTTKPKIKAKLANRVVEDWASRPGSTSANLLFRTGDAITYVLVASAGKDAVVAVIDAPAAKAAATPVVYASAQSLKGVLTVTPSTNAVTLARTGQSLALTVGATSARLNGGAVTLASAPYAQGGNVFVPVTALRSLQCTVATGAKNEATVTCGDKSAKVATVTR